MKARIATSLIAFAALLVASCAKESGPKETTLPQSISVEASVSGLTKAVTDGLQTSFEANDQLTLFVWTGSNASVAEKKVVNGVVNTFDGTKWTPASTMLWKNVFDAHYFLGISPSRTVTSFTADPVSSSEDLLVATILGDGIVAPQTVTAPPVALEFSHVMAWLKVNVNYRNQWGGVPEAVVTVKAAPGGTIDYLTKTIAPGTVTTQTLSGTAAATGYDTTYTALFIPQAIRTVNFTIAGQTLVYTHSEDISLEAGKITTLTLLVGKDKIALENNTVSDWDEGEVNSNMDTGSGVLANVTRPLTLKARENGTKVTFTDRSDGDVTWITSDGRSGVISLVNNTVSLSAGQRVWFLGDGTNNAFGTGVENTSSRIAMNKDCEVYGNIMSLLGPDFATATTLPSTRTFAYLFSGQTHLKNSLEEGLVLPATTLTDGCYRGMFKGCTGLGQVVLNATDISAGNCLTEWLGGIAGAGFSLITPTPFMWKMGDNLPWGATVYSPGESGPEAVYTAPSALATSLTYNRSAQNLVVAGTAHKDGVVLEYSTDGNTWGTSVPTGTNAGNYNVYCRVKDGGVNSVALPVTIAAKTVTNPTITLATNSYTYDGTPKTPAVSSVKDGTATIASSEYTVSYSDNTNASTSAKVTISDKTGGNYTVSGSKTFTINKADATKTVTITYNGDGTLSASSNNTGLVTVSYNDKTLILTRKSSGSGSCTITVSASAGKNYNAPSNQTISVSLAPNVTEWTFGFYTSGNIYDDWIQSFTVPTTGYYWLEVWGGQGGGRESVSGAKGGYAKGKAYLTAGTTLYITVGGKGANADGTSAASGGFNGGAVGGYGFYDSNWQSTAGCGGGGGATHISLDKNYIESFNYTQYTNCVASLKSTRYMIVAGGGGGSGKSAGTPGGTSATTYDSAKSGGENGLGDGLGKSSAGGGGGLEGGRALSPSTAFPGGYGGLSAYNSSYVSDFSHTTGARIGNGQAKITYIIP